MQKREARSQGKKGVTPIGAIIHSWFSCPQAWLQWSITTLNPPSSTGEPAKVAFTTRELIQAKPGSIPMIHYASSPDVTRSLCGRCGTNLFYVYEARDKKSVSPGNDIVLGTLDWESLEMEGVRPDRHFYWASGIEWVKNMVANGDSALNGMKLPRHPGESKSEVI